MTGKQAIGAASRAIRYNADGKAIVLVLANVGIEYAVPRTLRVGNLAESYRYDAYGMPEVTAHTFPDLDGDFDVDGFDFLTFGDCYNGSNNPPLSGCLNLMADQDIDGDVDGFDFLTFTNCQNGSNRPPLCEPSSIPIGRSRFGNRYLFTGREVDMFDFEEAGAGDSMSGGGAGAESLQSSTDTRLAALEWCLYSSAGGAERPLDFDGDGQLTEADLAVFERCMAEAESGAGGDVWSVPEGVAESLGGAGVAALDSLTSTVGQKPSLVLYHYRARCQNPGLGRFMQRDPFGMQIGRRITFAGVSLRLQADMVWELEYADGMNIYQETLSNPVRYLDPTGELAIPDCILDGLINIIGPDNFLENTGGYGETYLDCMGECLDDAEAFLLAVAGGAAGQVPLPKGWFGIPPGFDNIRIINIPLAMLPPDIASKLMGLAKAARGIKGGIITAGGIAAAMEGICATICALKDDDNCPRGQTRTQN